MKKFLLIFALLPFFASAQINQGDWLAGGVLSGSYNESTSSISGSIVKTSARELNIITQVGYFPLKKFATGLNVQISSINETNKVEYNAIGWQDYTSYDKDRLWAVGPFVRYYFANSDSKFNVYLQGSYQMGRVSSTSSNKPFNFDQEPKDLAITQVSAAPVYFVNKNIAVEFIMGYTRSNGINTRDNFTLGIGFQVHL